MQANKNKESNIIVLIPAYKPDEKLINTCLELLEVGQAVLVVNDGSGEEFEPIFDEVRKLGCTVLVHEENKGKGSAIKTGFNYCLEYGLGAVTADADGQHLPKDIINIAKITEENPDSLVLGVRKFTEKNTPARSLMGNTITRFVFKLINGNDVVDTQTGLRGFSNEIINKIIDIEGERYEYEMNILLEAKNLEIKLIQEEITVVYIDDNKASHFNTIKDGARVYKNIVKFLISSASAAVLDYGIFCILSFYGIEIIVATYIARLCSSMLNFSINKKLVFKNKDNLVPTMVKYYLLAALLAFLSSNITGFFEVKFGISVYVGKIIAEAMLYVISYTLQKKFVFKDNN